LDRSVGLNTPKLASGDQYPPLRTLATGIHALRSLDADCALGILPSLVSNAGERGTGHPKPPVLVGQASVPAPDRLQPVLRAEQSSSAVSAETVGGHAQKKGVVEDARLLIKTHETETLNTTGFEHASLGSECGWLVLDPV
jgi:hypothetical protein